MLAWTTSINYTTRERTKVYLPKFGAMAGCSLLRQSDPAILSVVADRLLIPVSVSMGKSLLFHQLQSALGAVTGFVLDYFRMH